MAKRQDWIVKKRGNETVKIQGKGGMQAKLGDWSDPLAEQMDIKLNENWLGCSKYEGSLKLGRQIPNHPWRSQTVADPW